jgi:hypothetical protein
MPVVMAVVVAVEIAAILAIRRHMRKLKTVK